MQEAKDEQTIPVLDHGHVRLVDSMGSDLSVVRSARVSFAAAWRAGESEGSDARLINYLWSHRHTTPFEAVTFTFDIKAPIFVFRQWHRHRTQSYNEMSARYTELPGEWYVPNVSMIGKQSAHNKQQRDMSQPWSVEEFEVSKRAVNAYDVVCKACYAAYQAFLLLGWPRELARMCLPVSMYSQMFCTLNLLNLLKFIQLRDDPHAQYEIQVYAKAMLELVRPIVPNVVKAFEKGRK